VAGANILTTSTALLASTALDAPVRKLALLNTGFKILGVQVALRSAVAVSHHG
jgi:Na+/phosphate symporter